MLVSHRVKWRLFIPLDADRVLPAAQQLRAAFRRPVHEGASRTRVARGIQLQCEMRRDAHGRIVAFKALPAMEQPKFGRLQPPGEFGAGASVAAVSFLQFPVDREGRFGFGVRGEHLEVVPIRAAQRDHSPWPKHAPRLRQRIRRTREVLEQGVRKHEVERSVREGQLVDAGRRETHVRQLPALGEHRGPGDLRRVAVDGRHPPRQHVLGETLRDRAGSAPDVEDLEAALQERQHEGGVGLERARRHEGGCVRRGSGCVGFAISRSRSVFGGLHVGRGCENPERANRGNKNPTAAEPWVSLFRLINEKSSQTKRARGVALGDDGDGYENGKVLQHCAWRSTCMTMLCQPSDGRKNISP